ncbi:hypothetical protein ABW19_dt0205926 [Dactylella cylindrospora]|nr:hypothetical protein ABW19_dt0205926 [Dactylella cylindrospora]
MAFCYLAITPNPREMAAAPTRQAMAPDNLYWVKFGDHNGLNVAHPDYRRANPSFWYLNIEVQNFNPGVSTTYNNIPNNLGKYFELRVFNWFANWRSGGGPTFQHVGHNEEWYKSKNRAASLQQLSNIVTSTSPNASQFMVTQVMRQALTGHLNFINNNAVMVDNMPVNAANGGVYKGNNDDERRVVWLEDGLTTLIPLINGGNQLGAVGTRSQIVVANLQHAINSLNNLAAVQNAIPVNVAGQAQLQVDHIRFVNQWSAEVFFNHYIFTA